MPLREKEKQRSTSEERNQPFNRRVVVVQRPDQSPQTPITPQAQKSTAHCSQLVNIYYRRVVDLLIIGVCAIYYI